LLSLKSVIASPNLLKNGYFYFLLYEVYLPSALKRGRVYDPAKV